MANNNNNKLGGGVAEAVPLRGINAIQNMGGTSTASTLVSGINDMVQALVKYETYKTIQRNEEDKVRAVSHAENEHLDLNNAMQGASYDSNLNQQVDEWRSSGYMESEVRLKAKEYKFTKSVQELGLDGTRTADNTDMAYFDTFNKLELKAITPLATADRKLMQDKISNINSSYIRTGSDDLQTKFNNTVTVGRSYGMTETDAMGNVMQSAFDLARRGDDSLLKELPSIKNGSGELLIDTADGSAIYSKLIDNLQAKNEHDQAKARKDMEFNQEVTATKIYTSLIDNKDLSSFKLNIDKALDSGSISMQQHNSLNTHYKTLSNVDAFPKNSDRGTYIKAYSLAEQGLLTTDQLSILQNKLSNSDFELITRKAIEKGGINGVGSDESKHLNERIKDDTSSFSGSSGLNDLTLTFTDKMIFSKRAGYIQQNLSNDVNKFIAVNRKLPNEEEYSKLRDKVVSNAQMVYNEKTVKPPETKVDITTINQADNINGRGELLNHVKTLKSKQEVDAWMNTLAPAQIKLLKGQ